MSTNAESGMASFARAETEPNSGAQADPGKALRLVPKHLPNLIGLARLLAATGQSQAAQVIYGETIKRFPKDVISRVDLGGLLLRAKNIAGARVQYEAALRIDSGCLQAHGGMYYALTLLGEHAAAEQHRHIALGKQSVFPAPYRGDAPPVPVLLLLSSTGGNSPIEPLLEGSVFQIYAVVADLHDPATPLPEHRLVINAIGDNDSAERALCMAESLLALTSAPVLNPPVVIRASGRHDNVQRLRSIAGVLAPQTALFPYSSLSGADGASVLARQGFKFPLLLRVPGFHMGEHFVRVESPSDLSAALSQLRESGSSGTELLAIEYLDARGADGQVRKYRVMMVGGQLYPLHLAISPHWKIHYFSADMANRADNRAEEAKFLADMPAVLGPKAMAALRRVQAELGLDYGGIDFGINARGEVLLFEANATMVAAPPPSGEPWNYRRTALWRVRAAARQMLLARASAGQSAVCATIANKGEPHEKNAPCFKRYDGKRYLPVWPELPEIVRLSLLYGLRPPVKLDL
jgi:glutathione synthase/RimK-type ligase-like ATP-grasp enzyme